MTSKSTHSAIEDSKSDSIIAYRLGADTSMPIVPAQRTREWMDKTGGRFAYHCLPLLIANQAGWCILNTHEFCLTWDGGAGKTSLNVRYVSGTEPYPAISHFGHGILSWRFPYLFRTPKGYNLLVRGPSNWPKDGIYPLEGAVEADWSPATFTMNWKVMRPYLPITFYPGEPICMIVPQRRGELEAFRPQIHNLDVNEALEEGFRRWAHGRDESLKQEVGATKNYEKHYFRGSFPDGSRSDEHQTKLKLHHFLDAGH